MRRRIMRFGDTTWAAVCGTDQGRHWRPSAGQTEEAAAVIAGRRSESVGHEMRGTYGPERDWLPAVAGTP